MNQILFYLIISITGFPSLFGLLNRIIIISFLAYSLPSLLLHMHYCFLYWFGFSHFQIHLQTGTLWSIWETLSCQGHWTNTTVLLKETTFLISYGVSAAAGFKNKCRKCENQLLGECSQILEKTSDYSVLPVIPNSVGRKQSRLLKASSQTLGWEGWKIHRFLCRGIDWSSLIWYCLKSRSGDPIRQPTQYHVNQRPSAHSNWRDNKPWGV